MNKFYAYWELWWEELTLKNNFFSHLNSLIDWFDKKPEPEPAPKNVADESKDDSGEADRDFDGDGDDGGSCIDGRLTSTWNWCRSDLGYVTVVVKLTLFCLLRSGALNVKAFSFSFCWLIFVCSFCCNCFQISQNHIYFKSYICIFHTLLILAVMCLCYYMWSS